MSAWHMGQRAAGLSSGDLDAGPGPAIYMPPAFMRGSHFHRNSGSSSTPMHLPRFLGEQSYLSSSLQRCWGDADFLTVDLATPGREALGITGQQGPCPLPILIFSTLMKCDRNWIRLP